MAIRWRADLVDTKKRMLEDLTWPKHENAGKETDKGMVLNVAKSYGSTYGSDDTYAVVWNEETQQCEHRVLSSMFGSFGNEQVSRYAESWEVDASQELQQRVARIVEDRRAKAAELRWLERNLEDAKEIGKGKRVKVVKGRKVAIGTEGIVKWMGEDNYRTVKVGLKVEGNDKLVYTAASNVSVVLPSDWNPTEYACDVVEY